MKKKILLIEDDETTIELYRDLFQMAGFEVEVLDGGQMALDYLKEIREDKREKPDLILVEDVEKVRDIELDNSKSMVDIVDF